MRCQAALGQGAGFPNNQKRARNPRRRLPAQGTFRAGAGGFHPRPAEPRTRGLESPPSARVPANLVIGRVPVSAGPTPGERSWLCGVRLAHACALFGALREAGGVGPRGARAGGGWGRLPSGWAVVLPAHSGLCIGGQETSPCSRGSASRGWTFALFLRGRGGVRRPWQRQSSAVVPEGPASATSAGPGREHSPQEPPARECEWPGAGKGWAAHT